MKAGLNSDLLSERNFYFSLITQSSRVSDAREYKIILFENFWCFFFKTENFKCNSVLITVLKFFFLAVNLTMLKWLLFNVMNNL